VLRDAGRHIDFLAVHHYFGFDSAQRAWPTLMARPLHYERFYRELDSLARATVPGRTIRLAINEYGLAIPESRQHGMTAALYGARLMHAFERSGPAVAMSAVSDLVNGWPGGIIQASRHGVFVTPLYHANRMYAERLGTSRLRAEVDGPRLGAAPDAAPALDVVASRSDDARLLYLKVVNADSARAIDLQVELRGARVAPDAEWELLAADAPGAHNTFAAPDAVRPRRVPLRAGSSFALRLPAQSVSVVTLRVVRD
jgi:alpha-N-arabinofuranosidase